MIQKHDLPILEYDFDSIEVIRPNHGAEQLVLPEKCVFGFLGDVIDDYAFEMDAVIAEHFETITKAILFISSSKMGWNFACVRHRWELLQLHSFWIF